MLVASCICRGTGIFLKNYQQVFHRKVDRKYFVEICEALGFEWEEIVFDTESDEEPRGGGGGGGVILTLEERVKQNSDRARKALDPYILPPIRRESLLEKCLKLIRAGTEETGFFTKSRDSNEIFSSKNPVSGYPCDRELTKGDRSQSTLHDALRCDREYPGD